MMALSLMMGCSQTSREKEEESLYDKSVSTPPSVSPLPFTKNAFNPPPPASYIHRHIIPKIYRYCSEPGVYEGV